MMNTLMKSAYEKLAKTTEVQSEQEQIACIVAALNDISASIRTAIFPIDDVLLPFVAAIFSQYNDLIYESMDKRHKPVYKETKDIIKKIGIKTEIKFPRKEQ